MKDRLGCEIVVEGWARCAACGRQVPFIRAHRPSGLPPSRVSCRGWTVAWAAHGPEDRRYALKARLCERSGNYLSESELPAGFDMRLRELAERLGAGPSVPGGGVP